MNEKNQNPSWKAIGYTGPDPEFIAKTMQFKASTEIREQNQFPDNKEELFGPLYRGIINMKKTNDLVVDISRFGVPAFVRHSLTIRCDVVVIG